MLAAEATRANPPAPEAPPAPERLLVCVGLSPHAPGVVRAAGRMAAALRAPWTAVYVETPAEAGLEDGERARVVESLRLAESLGGETATLAGERVDDTILEYARQHQVARLILGKSHPPLWRRVAFGSLAESLIRRGGEIDVYVVSREAEGAPPWTRWGQAKPALPGEYLRALAMVALCTGVAWLVFPFFELSNLMMIYLLGVVGTAMRSATGPSLLASVLSVAAFDFFFVHPYLTFAVSDAQYLVTFGVMFVVALVISGSTIRIRRLADSARQRERRTAALYDLSRLLASARSLPEVLRAAAGHLAAALRCRVRILLPDAAGRLRVWTEEGVGPDLSPAEQAAAERAFRGAPSDPRRAPAPGAGAARYVPLCAPQGALGVLRIEAAAERPAAPEELQHLEALANQTALALGRARLADEARAAQLRAETEQLRSSLLSSVSHDLRTPLSAITGAASSLLDGRLPLGGPEARELLETVRDEAERLNRLVQNLLQMTRLESGALQLRTEWLPLEEVVGAALARLGPQLRDRPVATRIPPDLPLLPMDDVLIEQVLINLLDNALKHAPAGTPIEVGAAAEEGGVTVEVADRGTGLRPGEEDQLFEKFYRGNPASRGAGLGLAICRGIVEAHGGRIQAANRPEGGAVFRFSLPITGSPPEVTHVEG